MSTSRATKLLGRLLRKDRHARDTRESGVSRHELCTKRTCEREHHGVRHRDPVRKAQIARSKCDFLRQVCYNSSLHCCDSVESFLFGALAFDPFVDFIDRNCWGYDVRWLTQPHGEFVSVRTIGEELYPSGRVENDHMRSFFSRNPVVRMPRTKPRMEEIGRSGTSVTMPPLAIT